MVMTSYWLVPKVNVPISITPTVVARLLPWKEALFSGKPVVGTSTNFNAIIQADKPVVVDFWAPWCGPCVGFAPVFEQVAQIQANDLHFVKVDTEAEKMLGSQFNIRSIPTLMVFKNGKVVDQLNGALPKQQFEQWLNAAVNK